MSPPRCGAFGNLDDTEAGLRDILERSFRKVELEIIGGVAVFVATEPVLSTDRCVIGTGNLTIPSLDVIVEGHAKPVTGEAEVRRLAAAFGGEGWPLEARGSDVYGPHGPTAGPPAYSIYRL